MSTRRSGRASKPESSAAGGRQEWSVEEDDEVNRAVARLGKKAWAQVAEELNASGVTGPGCARTGKQVRARWVSSLDPDIRSGPWTAAEERRGGRPTRAPPRVRVAVPGPAIAAARVPPAYSRAATAARAGPLAESTGFSGLGARDGRQGAAEPERPAPPERGARRAAPGGRALRRRGRGAAPAVGGRILDGLTPDGLMSPPGDSPSWNRATPHESPSWTGDKAADEAPWTGDKAAWTPEAPAATSSREVLQALSERFYAEIEPPRVTPPPPSPVDFGAAFGSPRARAPTPSPARTTRRATPDASLFGQADVKLPSVDTFRSIWLSEAA
ncbi:RNA polymerase II transcription regulator recruiting protein [Aureococcus anophagefferens]|nr:RNA polymerase II transcription regulator recruiting protein [Aureococcus anophagefferens]